MLSIHASRHSEYNISVKFLHTSCMSVGLEKSNSWPEEELTQSASFSCRKAMLAMQLSESKQSAELCIRFSVHRTCALGAAGLNENSYVATVHAASRWLDVSLYTDIALLFVIPDCCSICSRLCLAQHLLCIRCQCRCRRTFEHYVDAAGLLELAHRCRRQCRKLRRGSA